MRTFQGLPGRTRFVAGVFLALSLVTLASQSFSRAAASWPAVSGSIALSADEATLFVVNPDSGSVSKIETRTDRIVGELYVGLDPHVLTLSPDGRYLYVTSQGSATVSVVDAARLILLTEITVGLEPYGVVADPSGRTVYVASAATSAIEILDVFAEQPLLARIALAPKPKGLARSADGSRLYVTHFLTGEVTVIDTARRDVIRVVPTGADSNMSQKIVIHPTNGRAYLPHLRSNTGNRFLLFDTTVFPVLSAIDLTSNQPLAGERVDLSVGDLSVNLPFDVAFSPDGRRAYVVNNGSGELLVMDLATRMRIARIDVGDGPRGIVVTDDGSKAYVANSLSDDVSVVDLVGLRELRRIRVTTSPLDPQIKRGKILFFTSRSTELSRDRWMSCASCHFEGEHDGRTWFLTSGPRNTTSMRGLRDTRPLHWSADRDEVQDFEFTIRQLQAGGGLIRGVSPNPELGPANAGLSADLDALAAFVEFLRFKPSPYGRTKGSRAAAERGRLVFERQDVGCLSCHPPPNFTDSSLAAGGRSLHDVGTGDGPDERLGPAFDTPSLVGVWDTAPYLHDGSAPALRDVLVTRNRQDRHGRTSHLTVQEIDDLVAFLLTLEVPRREPPRPVRVAGTRD